MTFLKDNERGRVGELLLTDILEDAGFVITSVNNENRLYWDLEARWPGWEKPFKLEVKYDVMSVKTHNLAIEFFNSRTQTAAGIMATKADFWCQIIPSNPEKILIISVQKLKYIFDSIGAIKTVYGAGDGNADIMLYKLDTIESKFVNLNEIGLKDIHIFFSIEKNLADMNTNGFYKHPLYSVWRDIKQRCYNSKNRHYKNYGQRGIKFADYWINNSKLFIEEMIQLNWQKGLEIDRIDNDNGYFRGNIRFASRKQQMRNTTRSVNLTAFGETKCLKDWGKDSRCMVCMDTLRRRIDDGWNFEKAMITGNTTYRMLNAFNETKTMKEWSEDDRCKIPYSTLASRIIRSKWDIEKAIITPKKHNHDVGDL